MKVSKRKRYNITIIFDQFSNDKLIDKVIISTNMAIYKNRKKGKRHFADVKRILYYQLCQEEYHAMTKPERNKLLSNFGGKFMVN